MRTLYPAAAALILLIAGCSGPTAPPAPTAPSSASAPPSSTPSSPASDPEPTTAASGSGQGAGAPDDSGRFLYTCSNLNEAVPDVTYSSLAEVWASTEYVRLSSCTASFEGPLPFEPTEDEARIISLAKPGITPSEGLDTYLTALALCTRVSDDAASELFGRSSRQMLQAASELCPRAPQGRIIGLWASGERAADGEYAVADGGLVPGKFQLRKTPPEACTWSVSASDGSKKASGGAAEGQSGIILEEKDVLTSDKCGIWEKME
ncbi:MULTISPECIES: hypothetical protein [Micrococcaceae]|uniref:hypothetical protein n=1 Tax=Micrococcaceae TaxID=1268 RepID=UPI001CC41C4F|nr:MULTISPECIES: hypothetical protein [Micrococcaceae]MCM0614753.1 hypothetical protein [Paenarthrobacter sp. TYUT067]